MEFHPDDQPHWDAPKPPRPYLLAIIAIAAIALAVAAVVFNLFIAR